MNNSLAVYPLIKFLLLFLIITWPFVKATHPLYLGGKKTFIVMVIAIIFSAYMEKIIFFHDMYPFEPYTGHEAFSSWHKIGYSFTPSMLICSWSLFFFLRVFKGSINSAIEPIHEDNEHKKLVEKHSEYIYMYKVLFIIIPLGITLFCVLFDLIKYIL